MCELFGISCNAEDGAGKSLSFLAKNYSSKSKDGWGIAYYKDGKAIIKKAAEKAETSPTFRSVIKEAKSSILIAHLRFATQGHLCQKNCHPFDQHFLNKDWVFAHNGNIDNIENDPEFHGGTDSEHVFNHILDQIPAYKKKGPLRGTFSGIQDGIKKVMAKYGEDITLNFLMSDGTILYAYNHYKIKPLKPLYFLKRETKPYGSAFLISTQKLSDEHWKKIPADRLLMVCNGEVLELSDVNVCESG